MEKTTPRYPKLYQIPGSRNWYFMYTDPKTGKRKMKSTGRMKKGEAHRVMERFLDQLHEPEPEAPAPTFREYSEPFFYWDRCPHVRRLRHEDKQIGETHVRKSRRWLERVFEDEEFADLRLAKVRSVDVPAITETKWHQHRTIALPPTVVFLLQDRQDATVRHLPDDLTWYRETRRPLGNTWWRHAWFRA